jgi:hypothetical protein
VIDVAIDPGSWAACAGQRDGVAVSGRSSASRTGLRSPNSQKRCGSMDVEDRMSPPCACGSTNQPQGRRSSTSRHAPRGSSSRVRLLVVTSATPTATSRVINLLSDGRDEAGRAAPRGSISFDLRRLREQPRRGSYSSDGLGRRDAQRPNPHRRGWSIVDALEQLDRVRTT